MEARNYLPPPQVISQHEFKVDSDVFYASEKVVALPNNRLAVAIDRSYHYKICLSDDSKPEQGKIYLKKVGDQVTYNVIAPNGELVKDQLLYSDVPASFCIDKIDKKGILKVTEQKGHTQSPKVEIWDFTDNKKTVVAELKMESYVHSLDVSSTGQLYVAHKSEVTVWDLDKKKCIETIDVHALMKKRLSGKINNDIIIDHHENTPDLRLTVTPEGYLFLTGQDTLVIINLKNKSCHSVITTSSCKSGKIDVPSEYIATTSDSGNVVIVWNKAKQKAVYACSAKTVDDDERFMTIYFNIMPDGKVLYHNRSPSRWISNDNFPESYQILSLHKSKFPIFTEYYHSVEADYPMPFMTDFLLAFPGNKQFLYRCFPHNDNRRNMERNHIKKTWIFDRETGAPLDEAQLPDYGISTMLTDGRVINISPNGGLITRYSVIEEYLQSQETPEKQPAKLNSI